MRKKSTAYSLESHNQFQSTDQQIRIEKDKKSGMSTYDLKEGQSKFRVEKNTKGGADSKSVV